MEYKWTNYIPCFSPVAFGIRIANFSNGIVQFEIGIEVCYKILTHKLIDNLIFCFKNIHFMIILLGL